MRTDRSFAWTISSPRVVGCGLVLLAAVGCRSAPRPLPVGPSGRLDSSLRVPAPPDTLPVMGTAAPGMKWERQETLKVCEEPIHPSPRGREIAWPDSANAVAAARRAFGPRVSGPHMVVRMLVRTPDGIFIKFADTTPNILDGTASVYVSIGPCVTYLGW